MDWEEKYEIDRENSALGYYCERCECSPCECPEWEPEWPEEGEVNNE